MHQRVRAAALMAFPFCGNNSVPHAMLLSISLLFQSRVVNQSGHWPLARRCFCAVSTLLQLAWPVCSAHWTTSSPLSQSAHHTTTSPKPCSSKLVLRAPRPLAWFLAPPLPARSRSYHSIFTKCRTKYEGHIVTSSVVAFPCPPRAFTECFLHRPNTQPPFCRGQAFVVGWLCPSSLCPPSSSFISKATSFHAPLSFVAALVPQERGACSQPCGTGLLPRTSHIVATDELLSLVPKPSRRHLAIYFYASSHSIVGLLGSIKRPQQNVQPKDSTRSVE